ncbi:MAG: DUF512 domain-containing protein [Firmicutes bacterium]|nr:DUF512 domain-containing protein [Bacillota bacterium]
MSENIIIKVEPDSIAQEMGIEVGDILLDINGQPVKDVFDYRYLIQDEYIVIGIRKQDGEEWELEIEKDEYEDIGIVFETGLMDKAKSCSNKCIFCFIDQLPKGMRDTLYFKDDDSRLSFLQGNYVTLTNMKDEDLDRIIFYHLSPINVSVHTTDMELRKYMLKNPNAARLFEQLEKLYKAHIEMNFQIVLCAGINDGKYLDKSIEDLSRFIPFGKSMSIVPFGKSAHRQGLYPIKLFTPEQCRTVIEQVTKWQNKLFKEKGTRFCFLSDEFYLTAGLPLPEYDDYEGFPQLENGVGMLTLMQDEFDSAIEELAPDNKKRRLSVATGRIAYDFISGLCNKLSEKLSDTVINVYPIRNDFFGETITVSGLITGTDIINQLKDKDIGDYLLIPENAFRAETTVMLDDTDISDIEKALNVKVVISADEGHRFVKQIYEL